MITATLDILDNLSIIQPFDFVKRKTAHAGG